jgi:hypothetical protein
VARAANAAQFRVYALKATGLENRAPQHDVALKRSGASDNMAVYASPVEVDDDDSAQLQLAGATGGLYLSGNDPRASIDRVDEDLGFYYSLGYSPDHLGDGRYHRIEVRSRRPGLTVRARQGYVDLTARQRLELALASPLGFEKEKGSLPVAARLERAAATAAGRAGGDEEGEVTAVATVPMEVLTFLDRGEQAVGRVHLYLTLYDEQGQPVDQVRRSRDLSFPRAMRGEMLAEDLAYGLRFSPPGRGRFTVALTVVDDVSGDAGTAFATLER